MILEFQPKKNFLTFNPTWDIMGTMKGVNMTQLKIRWWNFKVIFEDHKGVEFSKILTYATDDPFEVRKILENQVDTIKIKGVLCIGETDET